MQYGISLSSVPVKVGSVFCINMYHKNAGCRDCLDICPAAAVRIGRPGTALSIDPELCIGCERCVSACRYGAFQYKGLSEIQWLDSLAEKAEKGKLILSCGKSSYGAIRLNCLSQLNAVGLLYLGIKDVREVMLYSGNCTECAFGDGKNFLRLQLKSLKRFSGSLKGCTISTGSSEHIVIRFSSFPRLSSIEKKQINVSRRGFFSLFGRELASGAFSAVDVLVEQSRESVNIGDSKKKSQRKVLFEKTISMLSPYIKKPLLFDRNIPFGTIRYSEENCDKCKLCITLCPSTALTKTEDGVIVHDSLSCTGCGVCIKACTNGCLQIEPESEYPQKLK